MRPLLAELGIRTIGYPQPTSALALEWKGRRLEFGAGLELPPEILDGLSAIERGGARVRILEVLVESAPPPAPDDSRSGIEWLRSVGMTERRRRSLERRMHNARIGHIRPLADFDWSASAPVWESGAASRRPLLRL